MSYTPDYAVRSQITTKIRDKIIQNIRRLLSAPEPKYTYVELPNGEYDFSQTKVIVSDIMPMDSVFYPAIIVQSLSANEIRYLGPETLRLVKNNSNVVTDDLLFDSITSTVVINIYTVGDTIARDELTDLIYNNFKYTTDDLANFGIEIVQTHFPTTDQAYNEGRWFLVGKIVMDLYSEWNGALNEPTNITDVSVSITLSE